MKIEIINEIKKIKTIKVVEVGDYTGVRRTVRVLKTGNWYKKLFKESIKTIHEDIKNSLKKNKDVKLYLYIDTKKGIENNFLYMSIDLEYDIN